MPQPNKSPESLTVLGPDRLKMDNGNILERLR